MVHLGSLLRAIMRVYLPIMKNVLSPVAKSVLTALGLPTAAIQGKTHGLWMTTLILLNKGNDDNEKS